LLENEEMAQFINFLVQPIISANDKLIGPTNLALTKSVLPQDVQPLLDGAIWDALTEILEQSETFVAKEK
jgi:hypothetical protein